MCPLWVKFWGKTIIIKKSFEGICCFGEHFKSWLELKSITLKSTHVILLHIVILWPSQADVAWEKLPLSPKTRGRSHEVCGSGRGGGGATLWAAGDMQELALPVPKWPSVPHYKWLWLGVLIIGACLLQAGSIEVLFLLTGLTSSCTFKIIQSKVAQKPSSCLELSVMDKV